MLRRNLSGGTDGERPIYRRGSDRAEGGHRSAGGRWRPSVLMRGSRVVAQEARGAGRSANPPAGLLQPGQDLRLPLCSAKPRPGSPSSGRRSSSLRLFPGYGTQVPAPRLRCHVWQLISAARCEYGDGLSPDRPSELLAGCVCGAGDREHPAGVSGPCYYLQRTPPLEGERTFPGYEQEDGRGARGMPPPIGGG